MKSHEELIERYEDALFAVMMEKITIAEGEELLRENERLQADPNFVIPEETDRRCRKAIAHAFGKRKCMYAVRSAWRVFQRVSVAAFIGILLFTGVYAASPDVRTAMLNLLIEVSDVSTSMSFMPENGASASVERTSERIYELSDIPDGFELIESGNDRLSYWSIYSNSDANITFRVIDGSGKVLNRFNTEDADNIDKIEVNGSTGLLVEKGEVIRAELADEENLVFIDITCNGLSKEDALNVIEGLTYTGRII